MNIIIQNHEYHNTYYTRAIIIMKKTRLKLTINDTIHKTSLVLPKLIVIQSRI